MPPSCFPCVTLNIVDSPLSDPTVVTGRNVPTRLAAGAVGSDFHQAGLRLKPQLVGLQAVTEPQFGYIYGIKAQRKTLKET